MKQRKSDRNIRNENIETLRVVSIVLIIAFHYVFHGRAGLNEESVLIRFSSEFIYHFGELGATCFFLISGYYLKESTFKMEKLILLVFQVEFYILISKLILVFMHQPVQWRLIDFFPFLKEDGYWFVTVYILIYLLQPFLKIAVGCFSKQQIGSLILMQIALWSVVPTVVYSTFIRSDNTESMPFYNRYIWFLIVYLMGYYFHEYGFPLPSKDLLHIRKAKPIVKLIFPFELLALFIIMGERGLWPYRATFFWTPNSVLMVFMSITLFWMFVQWKPKHNVRWILPLASATLGIYLFHDGELRTFLWDDAFLYHNCSRCFLYIGQIFWAVLCVFVVGFVLDRIRFVIEEHTIIPMIRMIKGRLKGREKWIP